MEGDRELLGDFRPAFTLWRCVTPEADVLIIQGEGGELDSREVALAIELLRAAINRSRRFATFYDLTDGMEKLWQQAAVLISFAREVRSTALQKQLCTVIVCPDECTRNWVRWILGITSAGISSHVVKTTEQGWEALTEPSGPGVQDAYGNAPIVPLSLAEGLAGHGNF